MTAPAHGDRAGPTGPLRLHVDRTACDGRGLCAELLPELLAEDDWGYPIVRGAPDVPPHLVRAARTAAARCPALALKLIATEG